MINLTNMNVLIVDDEASIRRLLVRKIEDVGGSCYTADSTSAAIELLTEKPIDLLITDYQMPLQTGGVLLDYVKQNYPQITRIVITGYSSKTIVEEVFNIGVYGYLLKPISGDALLISIENALRLHRYEKNLADQKEIVENRLDSRMNRFEAIMNNLHLGVMLVTAQHKIIEINETMSRWFPKAKEGVFCFNVLSIPALDKACPNCHVDDCFATGKSAEFKKDVVTVDGIRDYFVTLSPVINRDNIVEACLIIYEDITERLIVEKDLREAQKLESVGQLAAGIAHEINTPIQYVGDNVNFLKESFSDISELIESYNNNLDKLNKNNLLPEEIKNNIENANEDADLEYLAEELPKTLSQTIDGIKRVEKIVRAMKEFSHPGEKEKTLANINQIIKNTTTVCKNEWKYVANLELNLDDHIPSIRCYSSEFSQVILNMVVNAVHGIAEKSGNSPKELGSILISSSQPKDHKDHIIVKIADNGIGMSTEVQKKMFEPFYTTKERGKGTGQGLAISRRVIVDDHGGVLECSSEVGVGTEFTIKLPIEG